MPEIALERIVWGLAAGLVFAVLAWRLRLLTPLGAVVGGLFGATLIAVGWPAWAIPALTFFVPSSALSRVGRRQKAVLEAAYEKGSVRDAGQVLANGGVGWALLLGYVIWPEDIWYLGFLGAFAAATADTWATELGTLSRRRPRHLRTGQRVPPGTSGAVSVVGSLAALAGALVIWLSAWVVQPWNPGMAMGSVSFIAVVGGGFVASFVDSLLGATVQAMYRDAETGAVIERAGEGRNERLRGWIWMTNDRVNALATLVGAAFAIAVGLLF